MNPGSIIDLYFVPAFTGVKILIAVSGIMLATAALIGSGLKRFRGKDNQKEPPVIFSSITDSLKRADGWEISGFLTNALKVPYRLIYTFLGEGVSLSKRKYTGYYLEHLLLFYLIVCSVLSFTFQPVEGQHTEKGYYLTIIFVIWVLTNVVFDSISILWTRHALEKIINSSEHNITSIFKWLTLDLSVALACLVVTQIVSNGLYAIQTGHGISEFISYMFDPMVALKEYSFNTGDPNATRFAGTLLVSSSSYVPTLLVYIGTIILVLLRVLIVVVKMALSIFNVHLPERFGVLEWLIAMSAFIALLDNSV